MDSSSPTTRLTIQSDLQRMALLCGCAEIADLEQDRPESERLAQAEALEAEIDGGSSTLHPAGHRWDALCHPRRVD